MVYNTMLVVLVTPWQVAPEFRPQCVANSAWTLATLAVECPGAVWDALAAAARRVLMEGKQDNQNALNRHPITNRFFCELIVEAVSTGATAPCQHLMDVYQGDFWRPDWQKWSIHFWRVVMACKTAFLILKGDSCKQKLFISVYLQFFCCRPTKPPHPVFFQ